MFIVFEGIDGAGKTTQARRLIARLEASGRPAVYVKEPTGGVWGQKIREIAQNGRSGVDPLEELEWFVRDREEDVRLNIRPALDQGVCVAADRYYYSNIAYQSILGIPIETIRERNEPFPIPDRVFILEISLETSRSRITLGRGEEANLGFEQTEYLGRVKAVFDSLTDGNIVRIDGEQGLDAVAEAVWESVSSLF